MPLVRHKRSEEKVINDNVYIHSIIKMDPLAVKFMDTTEFQRLRYVKQLGLCDLVFPGATHCRLGHSQGVYRLASSAVRYFDKYWPELEIEQSDLTAVSLAGLLHDVGHGPFSHVFENEFLPRVMPGVKWHHEDMSEKIVDYIVDNNHIDIEAETLKRVKDYILCSRDRPAHGDKAFLFDIVANGRNSVDVDKLDYIARDSFACGVGKFSNAKRLMHNMKVIDNEICYKSGTVGDICDLFETRADLFRTVYTHPKVKAMELMVADALVLADDYMGISAHLHDPELFCKLDDTILKTIETSCEAELKEARELVWRLRKRGDGLYRYCSEFVVPKEYVKGFKPVRAEDIVCCATNGGKLVKDDIVVSNVKIDTCGKANALEGVHFFDDFESMNKYEVEPERVSCRLSNENVGDRIVRVYVRNSRHLEAARDAFEEYQRREFKFKCQVHATPSDKRRTTLGLDEL